MTNGGKQMSFLNKASFNKTNLQKFYSNYSYLVSFLILFSIATIINPRFLSYTNLSTLLKQAAIIGIVALGMNLVIIAGMIDLSVGSLVALTAGLGVIVLNSTGSIFLTLIFSLVFGTILGGINGILITKGKIAPFIVTLATMSAFRSIIVQLGQGGPFNVGEKSYNTFRLIAAGETLGIPNLAIIFIITAVIISIIMNKTKFGRYVYAVGSNENATNLTGINVNRMKNAVFCITGLLSGLSAFLLSSRLTSITAPNAGMGFELDAIASVAIGGTAMNGGRGKVFGTFLGAIMLQMINNILVIANIPPFLEGLVKGIIIIVAVLFQSKNK
ncbi:Ribose transport system permease protein rbsC [Sebaldella termitidis]|jgi:ribose transport system permease protein|uniref:Inner-membrane translocator n=1 Tax=Sebaldella termitidis (strain ATCC 33386 / NCTC 11300) TaxID=526218 RepID=D1AHW6_SEBTE|nr:ABC transporter permease [Sebaldella termitidis]ACZ08350.1 inner-membrane translocator [Sebaldella termitidis ATCC 33386]SUI23660.1 Ribose transport system permease protein rbsC [Sebaldella termitidis]